MTTVSYSNVFKTILDTKYFYRIKLMSDAEFLSTCVLNINKFNENSSDKLNIETPLFGNNKSEKCLICGKTRGCSMHHGALQSIYPIITNTLVMDDFFKVIQILCPFCSNLPIDNAKNALKKTQIERFKWCIEEVKKQNKNEINVCPYCKHKFSFISVESSCPTHKFYINQAMSDEKVQISPILICEMLSNMNDTTIDYLGFNIETYSPRNFMTKLIGIVPNKLRIKSIDNTSSSITNIYRHMLKDVLPELQRIYNESISFEISIPNTEIGKKFNEYYSRLNAWYFLFIDTSTVSLRDACLNTLLKRDRQHVDDNSSMISRLRDKKHSFFQNGITGTRHNTSARTVLSGASDLNCYQLGFPKQFTHKFGYYIPIYEENLEMMRQFVASMINVSKHDFTRVKALKLLNPETEQLMSLKGERAATAAIRLQPGMKLYISNMPGCLVQHCRFPSLREESWATHELVPTDHNVQSIPLSACGYKGADFDGDETQVYSSYSNVTDAANLLLHSIYKQFIQYKFGNVGIFFSADAGFESKRIKAGVPITLETEYEPESFKTIGTHSIFPSKDALDCVDKILDVITGWDIIDNYKTFPKIPKISYKDSKTVIKDNRIDRVKCSVNNANMELYLSTVIGTERVMAFQDLITHLGYLLATSLPITLGNEIKIYKNKEEVEKLHDECYEKMCEVEKSSISMYNKSVKISVIEQDYKAKIEKILTEGAAGTNLEKEGLLPKFSNEYFKSVIHMAPVVIDRKRIQETLVDNTRTIAAFSRFSVDPCAYGYIKHGYMSNYINASETFYDCMLQRKALFDKGTSVAISGYLSKKFIMSFGTQIADYNGAVECDNMVVSPCYGNASYNPRYSFKLPLIDINMNDDEFMNQYNDKKALKIKNMINEAKRDYANVTTFLEQEVLKSNLFVAGFDYEEYLVNNAKEGKTDQKIIEEFIDNITKVFSPEGMIQHYNLLNLIQLEYYFRVKLQTCKITRENAVEMYYFFINSLVDGGEAVGMKSAYGVAEALTQFMLDSIHHATGGSIDVDRLRKTVDAQRFDELLGGSTPKNSVLTLGFYEPNEEVVRKFALEHETIYFKDIWTKLETIITASVPKIVKNLHPDIDFDQLPLLKTYTRLVCRLDILGNYNIPVSELYNSLQRNFEKVYFSTGYVANSTEFIIYIFFEDSTTKTNIDNYITTWKMEDRLNVIHGKMLRNCYVLKNKNNGEWFLRANITEEDHVYEAILFEDGLDPYKCHTTDTKQNLNLYGIFESAARLNEETMYAGKILTNIGDILERHYKTICFGALAHGQFFLATANSADKIDTDYIRKINFEQPARFLRSALKLGKFKEIQDPIAAETFNEDAKIGDTYSKFIIFKK